MTIEEFSHHAKLPMKYSLTVMFSLRSAPRLISSGWHEQIDPSEEYNGYHKVLYLFLLTHATHAIMSQFSVYFSAEGPRLKLKHKNQFVRMPEIRTVISKTIRLSGYQLCYCCIHLYCAVQVEAALSAMQASRILSCGTSGVVLRAETAGTPAAAAAFFLVLFFFLLVDVSRRNRKILLSRDEGSSSKPSSASY